jgi:REP element-mobilizing transposase RayT
MGRLRRPNLPGGVFHLTARTLDRERLFTPALRTGAIEVIVRAVPASGARLLAVAIMPNHIHLVVQHGDAPLARLMQPILRRLAHALQRAHGRDGPMFWRPYACRACLHPGHVRNAIVYTHLNPVRAGLCSDPRSYAWTSHRLYASRSAAPPPLRVTAAERLGLVLDPDHALPLFATGYGRSPDQLRDDYRAFVAWRLRADRCAAGEPAPWDAGATVRSIEPPPPPLLPWGDAHWHALSPLFHAAAGGGWWPGGRASSPYRPDLADLARATLTRERPGLPLSLVKGRRGGATYSRIRRSMILSMHAAGHRNVDIARFLRLSDSTVSKVVCAARPCRPPGDGIPGQRHGGMGN